MNTASLELCKELYELSRWEDCEKAYAGFSNVPDEAVELTGNNNPLFGHDIYKIAPSYDLGYLLRKLPRSIMHGTTICPLILIPTGPEPDKWSAYYRGGSPEGLADTPEDALCKLAVELFKQGILPPQQKGNR